jgi:hypothetical protein
MLVDREMQELIVEARALAEVVNSYRFQNVVCESKYTVRLCEILCVLQDALPAYSEN